jgi:sulfite exporter TauE/SafE
MTFALLISALVMGFLGSSHCVLMCGGVVGALCSGLPAEARASQRRQLPFSLAYNAGRVLSYAALGALAGGLGALLGGGDVASSPRLALRFVAGALMVGVGLSIAGLFRKFRGIEAIGGPLARALAPLTRRLLPIRSRAGAFTLGLVWGYMPCGLVYSALGLAITSGGALAGASTMAAFGLGTMPMLLAISVFASTLASHARRVAVRSAAGIAIATLGVVNLAAASSQAGWLPSAAGIASPTCCASHH